MHKMMNLVWSTWLAVIVVCWSISTTSAQARTGGYVTVDDESKVQLYYEESGSGEPVLFVPGWIMTSRYFERQLDYFENSQTTRFITYDPRAQGRSSKTLDGANYRQHARDLKAFIDKMELKNVVLGGWSWGMVTVYAYLDLYGADNIKAIVNIDQTPYPLNSADGAWRDGDVSAMKGFFDAFAADRTGTTKAFLPMMFTQGLAPDELRWMEAETMLTPDIVAQLLYYDGWMFDHSKTARSLSVPQLYYVSQANAEAAKTFLKQSGQNSDVIALGGHAMFYDHATVFDEALTKFLARLPQPPAANR